MTNSNASSTKLSNNHSKNILSNWLLIAFAIVSLFGFIDATYLAVKAATGETPACSLVEGCDVVTASQYSELLGIPVAYLGVLYYLSILLLSIFVLDTKNQIAFRILCLATIIGLGASAWFVFAQLVLLDAICVYCMGSAVTSTTLFILGIIGQKKHHKKLRY